MPKICGSQNSQIFTEEIQTEFAPLCLSGELFFAKQKQFVELV